MNSRLLAAAGTLGIVLLASGCTAEEKKVELKDLKDKVSYGIGLSIGKDFQKQEIEINADLVAKGIRDGMTGAEPLLTEEQMRETQQQFQQEVMAKQESRFKQESEENKQKSEAFLAENAKKEGVKTTESGLQYQVIEEGTGPSPKEGDSVKVHYEGKLVDGTVFDSSIKRGEPATFPVSGVIPGWTEALKMMKEGAKWRIFIPPSLAYGERGAGQMIGPNSALIFDVELLKVNPTADSSPHGAPAAKPKAK